MLAQLRVENLALIQELELEFGPGLQILTGETGAGKSILLDAIGLLVGGRAQGECIRQGSETAVVEGVFYTQDQGLQAVLAEAGWEGSQELLITREISRSGRNRVRINGRLGTVGLLQNLGEHLVDIYGQHEHTSLLRVSSHGDLLDSFAGLEAQLDAYKEAYGRWLELSRRLERREEMLREGLRRREILSYQFTEIDAARIQPGEDLRLEEERQILRHAEVLQENLGVAYQALAGEEPAAADSIGRAVDALDRLTQWDPRLVPMVAELSSIQDQIAVLAREIRTRREDLEADPRKLEEIEARLHLLTSLKRKYGKNLEEVLRVKDQIAAELEEIDGGNQSLENLEHELARASEVLAQRGLVLNKARAEAGGDLSQAVESELAHLSMLGAQFSVQMDLEEDSAGVEFAAGRYRPGPRGFESIQFLFSSNKGEAPRPLAKIASGGEMSRIMLAIKAVLAGSIPTMVFDEIDAGISGRTAQAVAERLARISQERQVLCVTHLPQIASMADDHHLIQKREVDGRTVSTVVSLTDPERVEELARLLGGAQLTELTRTHAQEMLTQARHLQSRKP